MKIPTDPDEILSSLTDLSTSIRDGLDAGTLEVRQYFERRSRDQRKPVEINKPVATNIMRYVALNHVKANRSFGAEYHLEEMNNNGISARFDWCHVKVYKTLGEEPPVAHNTHRSRRFYSHGRVAQPKLSGIEWDRQWQHQEWQEIAPTLDIAHLIYGWEVDPNYTVIRVQLFCPRVSGKYKQGVKLFWRRDVPHPILGLAGIPMLNDYQEVDDLPVFFEDAAEQGDDD
jgi:hypothetical protein